MGRTITAFPWGGVAFSAPTVSGSGKWIKHIFVIDKLIYQRVVHSIAILHLFGIEFLTLRSDVLPISLFFSITGLLLIILTLSKNYLYKFNTPKKHFSCSERAILESYAKELTIQSKTFLDIAHAMSRPKKEPEIRDHLWSELMARMSHEFRTPLNAVIGFSELMHAETFGPLGDNRYRDYIHHIQDCCRDLLKNTENTLALTSSLGKENVKFSSTRISLIKKIKEICEYYQSETQKRCIDLQIFIPPTLEIISEESSIHQILLNVFGEALKRVHDGRSVEIRTVGTPSTLDLSFKILSPKLQSHYEQPSLQVCIARVLLEKQGAHLIQIDNEEVWLARFIINQAEQKVSASLKTFA